MQQVQEQKWTQESNFTNSRNVRGGNFADTGEYCPASDRIGSFPSYHHIVFFTRVTLYIE